MFESHGAIEVIGRQGRGPLTSHDGSEPRGAWHAGTRRYCCARCWRRSHVRAGGVYLDATFGAAATARAILQAGAARVFAIDRDPAAVARGRELATAWPNFTMLEGRFGDMAELLGGARRAAARWRGARSGRLLHAARRSRARLLVRRSTVRWTCACRARGSLPPRWSTRADARHLDRDLAALRRGACGPAHRQGDRPAPAAPAARAHARARRARRRRGRRAARPHRSGDAHLPGAAHPRQRRARASSSARCLPPRRCSRPAAGWSWSRSIRWRTASSSASSPSAATPRRARRATCPMAAPAAAPRWRLPAKRAVRPGPAEIAANPRARSARLRWAERARRAGAVVMSVKLAAGRPGACPARGVRSVPHEGTGEPAGGRTGGTSRR